MGRTASVRGSTRQWEWCSRIRVSRVRVSRVSAVGELEWCSRVRVSAHCFGTRRGISWPSLGSPVYAAAAKVLCSIQSKQKSGSSCAEWGERKFAEWPLRPRMTERNSSARSFSASVVGSQGGKKTVWVCPILE